MTNQHTTPLVKPTLQLGPDVIHMLRCISQVRTGDRFAFDAARVQRTKWGGPATEIDFDNLEMLDSAQHPDSYGTLIVRRVTPMAIAKRDFLLRQDPSLVKHEIGLLLKQAYTSDTEAYWLLSHPALRAVLFPFAFNDRRRVDGVRYYEAPGYKRTLGSSVWLRGLSRKDINQFHIKCVSVCRAGSLDTRIITPFLEPQKVETNDI